MQLPQPEAQQFANLMAKIKEGTIKIPQFQRDFVWSMQKSAALLDSVVKGYPIGAFIFWETRERLRSIRNLGGHALPDVPHGQLVNFVLDGQQRLTSLFACLEGLEVTRENGLVDDFSQIYVDLEADAEQLIVTADVSGKAEKTFIGVHELVGGDFTLLGSFPEKFHTKMRKYQRRITGYQYSIIRLHDASLNVATEVFTRINVGGQPLSLFEIMVAKTFDAERNFDLSEKYQSLVESLQQVNYETVSSATVLQTVSMLMKGECKRSTILSLDKSEFIRHWEFAVKAIERAVDYFRGFFRIPVSKLLPYNALVVLFAYFFHKHPDRPTGEPQKYLQDLFWRCALTGRYSSAVESKLAQDAGRVDQILRAEIPAYDWPVDASAKFIEDQGRFSASRSYVKAVLCIYAYFEPKSFDNDARVNISNDWLHRANSKNYHHFFPKAFLKGKGVPHDGNHVLNITIVDDFLNKRLIGAKPPSVYMGRFAKENPQLSETMKTHLIDNLDSFGIREDDYAKFIRARAERVSEEIRKRVVEREIDSTAQQPALEFDAEADITVAE